MTGAFRITRRWATSLLATLLVALTATGARSAPAQERKPESAKQESSKGASKSKQTEIAEAVRQSLTRHKVPGASVAVINDYRIDWSEGFGRTGAGQGKVTPATRFQAASVSKPVTAAAALRLVDHDKLDLDQPVNERLTSWKIPANEFTREQPVTLRLLLSHRAGMTVHGFGGYDRGSKLPTLVQVLNGQPPANSPAVRVDIRPGSKLRYSGGGYCVVQQLLVDVSGKPFPQFMEEHLLEPLEMKHSTYQQPIPEPLVREVALGHNDKGQKIGGGFHVYPERAAAGLWTTSADLARFVIDLENCHAGRKGKLFSQAVAKKMLNRQASDCGLGLFLAGQGDRLRFSHNGVNAGFRSLIVGCPATGQGVVVMTNGDNGDAVQNEVLGLVTRLYEWPPVKR
jgi:CubicO group peptidase (beta-lactamase class C family)